jgi:hypothetical protein
MKRAIVTFSWQTPGYRSSFNEHTVNALHAQCLAHYDEEFDFVVVTDTPLAKYSPGTVVVKLWDDFASIPNASWPNGPSCYRRLKMTSRWFRELLNVDRIICLDQDMLLLGDMRPCWNRKEPFLIWRPKHPRIPICASMVSFDAHCYNDVWERFSAQPEYCAKAAAAKMQGSDQAVMAHLLGTNLPGWSQDDGVYAFSELAPPKNSIKRSLKQKHTLPHNARAVIFTGKPDPWDIAAHKQAPWILRANLDMGRIAR